jgi:thymidylate synthase
LRNFDVLIIGSGLAGQSAALRLASHCRVALVSKRTLEDSASGWAQGGIAAVLDNRDSIEAHIRDTLVAGAWLNDEKATRFVVENGRRAIEWLIDQGVLFTKDEAGNWQIREVDQIQFVIDTLRKEPTSRRMVVTAWEPGNAQTSKLPPCHYSYVFNVQGNKLNCHLTQRSGDIALGIPFNLACYACLTQMIAQEVGLEVGWFSHTIVDAHIYTAAPGSGMDAYDHVPGLLEQLKREPRPLPRLIIAKKPFKELVFEDFKVEGYNPHPRIKFKVAV